MKKSYNPFLMLGSYLGLIFILVLFLFLFYFECEFGLSPTAACEGRSNFDTLWFNIKHLFVCNYPEGASEPLCDNRNNGLIIIPLSLIAGFLAGWGIHSVIRRLRK